MRELTADVNGPVHYADWGGAGPARVLVHGLGGSLTNWMAVGPALAASGRVLALDLPGFGRTPPAGRPASIEAQVATLAGFLERVAGGPSVVFGNSMGGLVASFLAAARPELVTRLVLVDPVLPRVRGVPADAFVTLSFLAYLTPGLGELVVRSRRRFSPRRFLDATLSLCGMDSARLAPDVLAAMIAGIEYRRTTRWADRAFLAAARAVARTGIQVGAFRDRLGAIRCPTLLVHGTRDRLVPVGFARAAAMDHPGWDLEILEGVGHVPQLEVPERFVEIVTRWLDAPAPGVGPAS